MGVAAVLGSLFVGITAQKFRLRWLAFVFMGLGLSLIPTGIAFLLPVEPLGIYIILLVMFSLGQFGCSLFSTYAISVIQARTPEHLMGKIMSYKIQQNSKKPNSYTEAQMLADLSVFSKQITLWGSSKVVKKWVQFRENSANPELARKNLLVLEDIINEMRKDLGLKRTKKGNLLAFFVNDIKQAIKSMK